MKVFGDDVRWPVFEHYPDLGGWVKQLTSVLRDATIQSEPLEQTTVSSAPEPTINEGRVIYVIDGDAGSPCLAVSDGTAWLRVSLGAAISEV